MPRFSILLIFFLVSLIGFFANGYNYCGDHELTCPNGHNHFECTKELEIGITPFSMMPMTDKMRDHILDYINTVRNEVASGNAKSEMAGYFHKARQMSVLVWDRELEYCAHLQANYCHNTYPNCSFTSKFQFVGTFTNMKRTESPLNPRSMIWYMIQDTKNLSRFITNMNEFLNEGKYTEPPPPSEESEESEGSEGSSGPKESEQEAAKGMHNFLALIDDHNYRVGCAMSVFQGCGSRYCYAFICKFNHRYHLKTYVYNHTASGRAGNDCGSRWFTYLDDSYKFLCFNKGKVYPEEKIDPLQWEAPTNEKTPAESAKALNAESLEESETTITITKPKIKTKQRLVLRDRYANKSTRMVEVEAMEPRKNSTHLRLRERYHNYKMSKRLP